MLIDSHCHLHDEEFFSADQAEAMITRAHKAGVDKIVCIGTSHEDSLVARDFASAHENAYWTYGVHPENAMTHESDITPPRNSPSRPSLRGSVAPYLARRQICSSEEQLSDSKLIAVGEVGLDYHYEGYNREAQIKLFEQMLQLAKDNDLPVSFHVREAFDDFFGVVANFPGVRGVVHSFTDSKKTLKRILNETDFYIGVNGLATYSTLPTPPLERILLETDAPFLAPVPHRGETNEPAYIADIAKWLGAKLDLPLTEVAKITSGNVTGLFGI